MTNLAIDTTTMQPDYTAIKAKQQATWGAGNYGRIGVTLQITGEQLCETMDLRAGRSVLDVAAGNGNVTLAAARRFCRVTSTDYVDSLLRQSEQRALVEGMSIDYRLADAENLPFEDGRFDHVVSTFGVMFAPDQAKASAELVRVCRSGGSIGMANWTPDGFIGHLFKTIGRYVPPPQGVNSPAAWGTREFIGRHFGAVAEKIDIQSRMFNFRYPSAAHWLDLFRTYYGPVHKAFAALPDEKQQSLAEDILSLVESFNVADDGSVLIPSEYLEIVITRK